MYLTQIYFAEVYRGYTRKYFVMMVFRFVVALPYTCHEGCQLLIAARRLQLTDCG